MSLQQKVNLYPDIAFEGSLYREPIEATAGLASVDVTVARGVFSSVTESGINVDLVSNVKGAGIFVGFAYRANLAPNLDISSEASMIVPKGFNVSILSLGSVWVKNATGANKAAMGYVVFVKDSDGTIATQVDDTPIANYTVTKYKVIGLETDGSAGSLILISNVL